MTPKQVIERLEREGWQEARRGGSDRQFKHPQKRELITVPEHRNKDLAPGTLADIKRKAGW
jgi:predicted RNA binding protein YcfA (HicA-like mRNA interferase family)